MKGIDVRPSTLPGAGMGLFVFQDFRPGQKVADYSGQIVSARNVVSTLLLGKKVNTLMQVVVKTQMVDTQIRVEEPTKRQRGVKATMSRSKETFDAVKDTLEPN